MRVRAWPILLAGGAAALASVVIARRNQVEPIDPQSLIIRLGDEMPERILKLEGVANFRDAGGYRTAEGRQVRKGLIYRSGALGHLTPTDWETINKIGIKLVCDLRSRDEAQTEPDNLVDGIEYLHLPLDADTREERRRRLRALLFNRRELMRMMPVFYTQVMIDRNAALYGTILKRLADPANLPAVIHCTAGKDRTGVGVALLLTLLGVPEDVVIADYSLSNLYYDNFYQYGQQMVRPLAWLGIRAEAIQPLLVADPNNIRLALGHVRSYHGGIENYLRTAAGLDDETLQKLRNNFLE
ncbi:MAG: tyrosine-protein phosphatase [Anaerolineae bacterium]|nr:tyrosine-protein phosphatase [Anaerolineae bacterium]